MQWQNRPDHKLNNSFIQYPDTTDLQRAEFVNVPLSFPLILSISNNTQNLINESPNSILHPKDQHSNCLQNLIIPSQDKLVTIFTRPIRALKVIGIPKTSAKKSRTTCMCSFDTFKCSTIHPTTAVPTAPMVKSPNYSSEGVGFEPATFGSLILPAPERNYYGTTEWEDWKI